MIPRFAIDVSLFVTWTVMVWCAFGVYAGAEALGRTAAQHLALRGHPPPEEQGEGVTRWIRWYRWARGLPRVEAEPIAGDEEVARKLGKLRWTLRLMECSALAFVVLAVYAVSNYRG